MKYVVTLTITSYGLPVSKEYEAEAETPEAAIKQTRARVHATGKVTISQGWAKAEEAT